MDEISKTYQLADNSDPQANNPWFIVFGAAALGAASLTVVSIALMADISKQTFNVLLIVISCLEIVARIGILVWMWSDGQRRGGYGWIAVILVFFLGIIGWVIWLSFRPYEQVKRQSPTPDGTPESN